MFSAKFVKRHIVDQVLNGIDLYNNFTTYQNSTVSDIDKTDFKSQLEHQIQNQESKDSGWTFDKTISGTKEFYKTSELNSSSYIKIPLGSSTVLNLKNDNIFCFPWSISAHLHPIADPKMVIQQEYQVIGNISMNWTLRAMISQMDSTYWCSRREKKTIYIHIWSKIV